MKNGHPLLYMSGGSICPDSNLQATTAVQCICDKSVFAAGKPELVAQAPLTNATACAFSSISVPILHALTTNFSRLKSARALTDYIVFMTLYNRYTLHLNGFDQIPSLPHRLTEALSIVSDWFQSVVSKFSSREGGLNLSSHHWSVGGRDIGVGGSRFGSGSRTREEEEAMLSEEDFEAEDDVTDDGGNPWERRGQGLPGTGIDSAGVIRL